MSPRLLLPCSLRAGISGMHTLPECQLVFKAGCSSAWPWICSNPLALSSQVFRFQACTTSDSNHFSELLWECKLVHFFPRSVGHCMSTFVVDVLYDLAVLPPEILSKIKIIYKDIHQNNVWNMTKLKTTLNVNQKGIIETKHGIHTVDYHGIILSGPGFEPRALCMLGTKYFD